MIRILVADDEAPLREALVKLLEKQGWGILQASDGAEALEVVRRERPDVLLADLRMPSLDGLQLLTAAKTVVPDLETIVLTGHGSIEEAVEAMKQGAYDFVTKPFRSEILLKSVRQALEKHRLSVELRSLQDRLAEAEGRPRGIVGNSAPLRRVLEVVQQVAPTQASVLITGESGTGKELVAEALHHLSPRKDKPLVKVACAALPETLLESELFGYEKGAFTGAVNQKPGRFELAGGGTLFLDEIGDISPATQAKLLRVLQEGEFERVGGTRTLRVDIRVVTATHRDLPTLVREGKFREDLFYRLNVILIALPPLRERAEDIPLLVQHFVTRLSRRNAKDVTGVSHAAMKALSAYPWPGNVRELENVIERAVVLARTKVIEVGDLPESIAREPAGGAGGRTDRELRIPIGTTLDEIERRVIEETLRHAGGDKETAARLLGISSRTIYRKVGPSSGGGSGEPDEGGGGDPPPPTDPAP